MLPRRLQILEDFINESSDYTKDEIELIGDVLSYVYSFGDERLQSILDLERGLELHKSALNKLKFVKKLPINKTVYRWFDYRWTKSNDVKNAISDNTCYDRGRLAYSFSNFKNEKEFLKYAKKFDYGILTKYNLSKAKGYAILVNKLLLHIRDVEIFGKLVDDAHKTQASNFLESIGFRGLSLVAYNKKDIGSIKKAYRYTTKNIESPTDLYIDEELLHKMIDDYLEQKEIILISDITMKICPENIIKFLES